MTVRPDSVSSRRPTASQPNLAFQSGNTRLPTRASRFGGVPPTGLGAAFVASRRAAAVTFASVGSVVVSPAWSATTATTSAVATPASARPKR